jgi:hypothetical protein
MKEFVDRQHIYETIIEIENAILDGAAVFDSRHACTCQRCGTVHTSPARRVYISQHSYDVVKESAHFWKFSAEGVGVFYGLTVFIDDKLIHPEVRFE